jgi:hypothetical protein
LPETESGDLKTFDLPLLQNLPSPLICRCEIPSTLVTSKKTESWNAVRNQQGFR